MIDTNVLARFADQDSVQHGEAVDSLRQLQAAGHLPVFNPQIKREFLDVAERPKGTGPGRNGLGLSNQQTCELIAQFQDVFGYLADVPAVDEQFDRLHGKYGGGKSVHDLNIVASMLAHGVTSLLTFNDKHFRHLEAEGISVQTPQQYVAADQQTESGD
ncbi:type II toxin-antitoxin system VapC family toxin [Caulifigura coniformis]|nr:type II toxin-antitoxin system VapC family toxin [Caulifigura coniformis]